MSAVPAKHPRFTTKPSLSESAAMNSSTSSTSMIMMTPWLHFGDTDYLIFKTWRPSSQGAVVGACIGLFLFCILERSLAAYRRTRELRWKAKPILMPSGTPSNSSKEYTVEVATDVPGPAHRRLIPPFIPSQDVSRGVIHAMQSTFSYILMLAIMTFNGAYIISVILGLGVGETLFGRIGRKQQV